MKNSKDNCELISIKDEMETSYLNYAMSVIVCRALPDVRDGLKPVHRRLLYSMYDSGCTSKKPYRKCARVVGDVMGRYHPHGESAIYESVVRMAQDFSLNVPLIDGQGNFGSMDGDSAAAMRYTECKLTELAENIVVDYDKDTVNMQDNYDGSTKEPVVLPSRFPNILVTGNNGIAVGMSTAIPPYNLTEVINATLAVLENPDISDLDLYKIIPAPDFPTGGKILLTDDSYQLHTTGKGRVIMRGCADIIDNKDKTKQTIIISAIPYQVNKASLVERIAFLARDKKIEGISDLRDESNKDGVRVVIELKKNISAEVIVSQLYHYTSLQLTFSAHLLVLNKDTKPCLMNIKQILDSFIFFRREVVTRRTDFLLNKAQVRSHVLFGFAMAVLNIETAVDIIKKSPDIYSARENLMNYKWPITGVISELSDLLGYKLKDHYLLTMEQAHAILEMKLSKLTNMETENIRSDIVELSKEISRFNQILGSQEVLDSVIQEELELIKDKFSFARRSEIIESSEINSNIESLIPKEDMVVTLTNRGYVKRVLLDTYKTQNRGGKGRIGVNFNKEDFTKTLFVGNTHSDLLFFSNHGKVYKLKLYKLPIGAPTTQGRALVNIFPVEQGENIHKVIKLPDADDVTENCCLIFSTSKGQIRRSTVTDFMKVQSNGKIAIKLEDDDKLVEVCLCKNTSDIFIATKNGKSIRFPVNSLRIIKSRSSTGVKAITLAPGDEVVSMTFLHGENEIMKKNKDDYLRINTNKRVKWKAKIEELERQHQLIEESKNNTDKDKKDKETIDQEENLLNKEIIKLDESLKKEVIPIDDLKMMLNYEVMILTITKNGYGKRTSSYEYRMTSRGGKGITNISQSKRNGSVFSSVGVSNNGEIMLVTDKGKIIRCGLEDIRVIGRKTQGVKILNTHDEESVVGLSLVESVEKENLESVETENLINNNTLEN